MRVDVRNREFTIEDLLEIELTHDRALRSSSENEKTAGLWGVR